MFYLKNNLNSWVDLTYLEPWTHWYCGCLMELCAGFHRLIYKIFVSYVLSKGNRVTYLIATYIWGKNTNYKIENQIMKSNNFLKFSELNLFKLLIEFSSSIDYFILLIWQNSWIIIDINDCKCIYYTLYSILHQWDALNNMNFIQYCM